MTTKKSKIDSSQAFKKDLLVGQEVEKKLQDLKEQYSIETTFEEVKELENKS